jgi:ribosomal protein S27E
MTPFTIHCPSCAGALQIDLSLAGQQVQCPLCQTLLALPPAEAFAAMTGSAGPPQYSSQPTMGPPPSVPRGTAVGPSPGMPGVPMGSPVPPTGTAWPPMGQALPPMGTPAPQPNFPSAPAPAMPSVPAPRDPQAPFAMACPACTKPFRLSFALAGQPVACPHCARQMTLPPVAQLQGIAQRGLPAGDDVPFAMPQKKEAKEAVADKLQPSAPVTTPPAAERPKKSKRDRAADLLPPAAPVAEPTANAATPATPPVALKQPESSPPSFSAAARETLPPTIADLLPPAAPDLPPAAAPLPSPASSPTFSSTAAALLPPGAEHTPGTAMPGEERPLPPLTQPTPATPPTAPPGMVVLPTADGRYKVVKDTAKVIGRGADEVELRRLTPEEKARRRMIRNLVLAFICIGILGLTTYLMMGRG